MRQHWRWWSTCRKKRPQLHPESQYENSHVAGDWECEQPLAHGVGSRAGAEASILVIQGLWGKLVNVIEELVDARYCGWKVTQGANRTKNVAALSGRLS